MTAASKPSDMQPFFKMARDPVAPYAVAGKFKQFKSSGEVVQGMRPVVANEHTPGRSGYLFASKGRSLFVWGDIMHSHTVQFQHPEVAFEYNANKKTAVATRRKLLAEATQDKFWMAGAHLPFLDLGHVHRDDNVLAWALIEYGPLHTDHAD